MGRRKFISRGLKLGGAVAGAAILGSNLLIPEDLIAADIKFIETECGKENLKGQKILLAYASYTGTTGEVSEAIGKILCEKGASVDIRLAKNIKNISGYQAVIIGSAIQKSNWLPEAYKFIDKNNVQLSQVPMACFITCLALAKDTEGGRETAAGYVENISKKISDLKPLSFGSFAGVLDYGKLSFFYRSVMKRKIKKKGIDEGDYRNWDKIRSWSDEVSMKLS